MRGAIVVGDDDASPSHGCGFGNGNYFRDNNHSEVITAWQW
jgi:hypothetical protein